MPKHTSFVRFVSCTLVTVTTIFSPFHSLSVHAQTPPPSVVIGEVAWAGSTRSTSDEWFELWNLTNAPISVGGWSLTGAGDSSKTIFLPATATIPALGAYLVSNYASGDPKSELVASVDVVTTTVSLSNSTLSITLFDAQQHNIDAAGNGKTPIAGTTSPIKASMIRTDATTDGASAASWTTATTSQNMVEPTTNLGTPGFCDGCSAFVMPTQPVDPPTPEPEPTSAPVPAPEQVPATVTTDPSPVPPTSDPVPATSTTEDTTTTPTSPVTVDPPIVVDAPTEPVPPLTETPTTPDPAEPPLLPMTDDTTTTPLIEPTIEPIVEPIEPIEPSDPNIPTVEIPENPTPTEPAPDADQAIPTVVEPTVETTTTPATTDTADLPDPTASSTGVISPSEPVEPATSSTDVTPTMQAPQTPAVQTQTVAPPTPNYGMLRLNEVTPNPASGKEWVEIVTLDSSPISLTDCEIHDATGRIFTFGDVTINAGSTYAVAEITSSRLNNDGDTVSLFDPSGNLINSFVFGNTDKGTSWIRLPDGTGDWESTLTPTEGAGNILTQTTVANTTSSVSTVPTVVSPPATVTLPSSPTVATSTPTPLVEHAPVSTVVPKPTAPTKPTSTVKKTVTTSTPPTTKTVKKPVTKTPTTSTKKPAPKTTKTPTKKTTTASSTSKTSSSAIIPITFDMLNDQQDTNLRVKLQGSVGTMPGLLAKHGFILLADDGRGLFVSVPTSRSLPASGNVIAVTGSLRFNNLNVPYLSLTAKDGWTIDRPSTGIKPRTVDLLAPSIEDDWSLVHVTGTVDKVGTASFHLDLGDAALTIAVRPIVQYRVKRLVPGDTVTVTGLLDTSGSEPTVYPRSAEDITLVAHATPKQSGTVGASSPLNGWTPFGAAGGALALTEGTKQLQRRRQKKLLEKKMADLTVGA